VGFVQMTGSIEQNLQISAGTYTLNALAAQRGNYQAQNQTVDVYVDGGKVGSFAPTGTVYVAVATNSFSVADGTHTIKFIGLANVDSTLFLDAITLVASTASTNRNVTIAGSGFESPNVGTNKFSAFAYNPTGSPWTFTGNAGIAGNNSGFTAYASNAPEGTQVAFLQTANAVIAQTLSFPSNGNYTLVLAAASRGGPYNQQLQTVNVYLDGNYAGSFTPTSTTYQTVTLSLNNVAAGSHQLSFQGTVAVDSTAFIDNLALIGP
jgi:hypothetical protein